VFAPRRRLDETLAARKPVLSYRNPAPEAASEPSLHEQGDR
jgi:glycine dehydrogenase subunit 2